tara:strand:+ start:114 stop:947 length:834 start_codon:yes stop_codon:yes gene_type:complete
MFKIPRTFSYSSASMFKQCPRRWKHKYIDKLPDPAGEAALIGTFAHDVLEQLCDEEPARRTEVKAKEIAGKSWAEFAEKKDFKNLKLDEESQRAFRWQTWNAIQGLWQLEDPATIEVEATEQKLSTSLSGVPFFGIVDRLDRNEDGITVVDYKTGKFNNENIGQVLLYSAAVASETGEQPSKARLLYLGSKKKKIAPQIVETDVSENRLTEVVEGLSDTWNKLKAHLKREEFEPVPTPLCGWCSFITECEDGIKFIKKRASLGKLRPDTPAKASLGL